MTEDKVLSQQEVEELLKESNQSVRKANQDDRLLLKNEFMMLLAKHIKSSDKELVGIMEEVLDNIDTMEIFIESEDAERIVFTYSEPKQGECNELADTVYVTVKL